jgi:hypothetical protein
MAMAKTLRGAILVRIVAPHFVAGIIAIDGAVFRTAPILHFTMGWDGRRVARYCDRNGWTWQLV